MRSRLLIQILIHHAMSMVPCWSFSVLLQDRRAALQNLQFHCFLPATTAAILFPDSSQGSSLLLFETTAYGRQEYTNSITASRDTNLSPAEAYDVIRQKIPPNKTYNSNFRALDLGAGAGLSTAILCNEKGYVVTDAVDWSRTAWDDSVTRQPSTIQFYEMDDSAFFEHLHRQQQQQQQPPRPLPKYDVIVYNFACNFDKAVYAATTFLNSENPDSILLAPVNDRSDYWYKQTYVLLDCRGNIVWKSDPEVGAWSVQFQPDVTAPSCVGIWCGGFNGYQSNKKRQT